VNQFYDFGLAALRAATLDWIADTFRVLLVHTGGGIAPVYSPNPSVDRWLSDIPVGAQIAFSAPLTGKAVSAGHVLTADPAALTFVGGPPAKAFVVYNDSGTPSTSKLLLFFDSGQGLPFVPYFSDLRVNWNPLGVAQF
jgi:hypothetical protein